MRCLVLAEALRDDGYSVLFATRAQVADLNDFILSKGFSVINLMQPSYWQTPTSSADYAAWLQVSEIEDSQDFINKVANADLIIVDHYGVNIKWHNQVKQHLSCTLMVIDDLVREHDADILLDQTLNRDALEYTKFRDCLALTGTDYALLKPGFRCSRETLLHNAPSEKYTILISMGGIDLPNASLSVLVALQHLVKKIPTTVLLSMRSPNYEEVKAFVNANSDWVNHVDFVDNMPEFMAKYSVMVGAPGSTSWERACLGIPSIIVPIADNQQTIALQLESANAVKVVELENIKSDLVVSLEEILSQWQSYRAHNFALCDGLGCDRALKQLKRFMEQC
ncbi:hypothetical protein PCARR_a0190 [Pseudoalteromonas carrageenovora IAM 12662]|nr:hypothetical protein [Pseudoalteromonas carrageenovora IAM 12662]